MSDSDLNSRPTTPNPEAADRRDASEEREGSPAAPVRDPDMDMDDDDEGNNSLDDDLSEVDEAEFADFDPATVALEDRPLVDIDEDIAKTLKASKRKTAADGKKPKEGKRDKKKRRRDDDEDPDGQRMEGKRARRPPRDGERRVRDGAPKERKQTQDEEEANWTPEQRRKAALDRQMDAALKNPNKRRKKKGEDVSVNQYIFRFIALTNMTGSRGHVG